MWGDYNLRQKVEMIKKKEGCDQGIDGKQPIQGQGYRQTCTSVLSPK